MKILILVAVLFVMGIVISMLVLSTIRFEKKQWNGGICPSCGSHYRLFDTDSQGGRGYRCNKCRSIIWISYNFIDKEYRNSLKQFNIFDQEDKHVK